MATPGGARRSAVRQSLKRESAPDPKGGSLFSLSSARSFFMPNSLLELATKAAEKTAEKAQALKGLFGAPKRAVLVVQEDQLLTGSVFSVRDCSLEELFAKAETDDLPPVNRDPEDLRKYSYALVMSDLPGQAAEHESQAELQQYVQWVLQVADPEWDGIARVVQPTIDTNPATMQLEVDLIRGLDLSGKDTDGKSDPYCTLQVESNDGTPVEKIPVFGAEEAAARNMQVSSVMQNTVNPQWNEEFKFTLPKSAKSWNELRLHLVAWDSDRNESRGRFNPIFVGRALKDAARKVAGKGCDDFLGHAILELHRVPRGGLFLHSLNMEKRSKRSHVDGSIEITVKFAMPSDQHAVESAIFQDVGQFRELLYRIVLCESPLWKSADGMWNCTMSKWAHSLVSHGTFTSGLSLCQSLSCELDVINFCNKNPDLPRVHDSVVTNLLSQLLFQATRETLTPSDTDFLTSAVTNVMAEREEDLQNFLDEERFERSDHGEEKLRSALTQYSLCFSLLKIVQGSASHPVSRPPPSPDAPKDQNSAFRVQIETLTGNVQLVVEPTYTVLEFKALLFHTLGKRCVVPSQQHLSYHPANADHTVDLSDDQTLESYEISENAKICLMDAALQEAVKSRMRNAFRPHFQHLVKKADAKALQGSDEAYPGHEIVASIQLVQSVLADLMVLEDDSAFRGVLERFGGKDGATWAYIEAVTCWDNEMPKKIMSRLPKHTVECHTKEERDTAMALSQFSFKLFFEIQSFCQSLRTHNVHGLNVETLTIFRYPSWFFRQIESYFVTAEGQGKEKMLSVVSHDALEKFSGAKYSTSVRDVLKIAYEVLDTWDSLGPSQWTQVDLDDTLLEEAIAWNVHLSSVITELIESWIGAYKKRHSALVQSREVVVVTDEEGRAMVTEAGCVALNNVCQVITSMPDLHKKIESILVSLHQHQVVVITRILRSQQDRSEALVKEKQRLATDKLQVLDYEFSDIVEQCSNLQNEILDSVTGEVSETLSRLLLDACVSGQASDVVDPEKIAEELNPPLDYLYNNLMNVVKKHSFDQIFEAAVKTFWRATLQSLIESALCTHSLNDRLQLGQKFIYIKDEFKNYGLGSDLLEDSDLSKKVNKIIELKMSNTGDIFVEYLWTLNTLRPRTPTKLGSLTVAALLTSEEGGEGTSRTHKLEVYIKHADNLVAMDKNGFSDPVIVATLYGGEGEGVRQKSSTQRKTINPKWGETLTWEFSASRLRQRAVHLQVFDVDDTWEDKLKRRGASDPMGEATLCLSDFFGKERTEVTMHLTGSVPPSPPDESALTCNEVLRILKDRGEKNAASPKEKEARNLVRELENFYGKLEGQDGAKWAKELV